MDATVIEKAFLRAGRSLLLLMLEGVNFICEKGVKSVDYLQSNG